MNDFCLIYKLCILIFFGLSFLVHGQNNEEGTIYTKWPLCKCKAGIKKDVHHDILTKEAQEYQEFHTSIHDENITTDFNFSTIKSGNERKLIFHNYPREKFEPFIFQCDGIASWNGFQSVNIGKGDSGQLLFVRTVNCERSNDIHIIMPLSHGCNQLPEGFKELDVDKSVVLDNIKKMKKLIVNCKVTRGNLELDIHIPVQCANFNINFLSSPLIMHLQNEYFSDTTKRSIAIKKTTDRKVVVTFFIDDKHPEEVTDFSKSILVWGNNKSESYELTTKDLAENNIKFTHKLLGENKSDGQCLNQHNLLLSSQPKLPQGKKRSADDAGSTDKAKGKKNSRVTIAKVQPVKKASKTVPKDKQRVSTVTSSATTEIGTNDVISNFTEAQQAELQAHLADIEIQAVLRNASTLLVTLNKAGIKFCTSLFSTLKSFNIVKNHEVLSGYFKNANVFFLAVNPQQIKNTSCLTSMVFTMTQVIAFVNEEKANIENIKMVAGNRYLKQLASICHRKGFPNKDEAQAFLMRECWKLNGEFSLPLLRAFSSMCHSKGLPNKIEVEECLAWECWKLNGEFSLNLLQAFSSMHNGKGLPKKKEVEEYLAWECWKINAEFNLPMLRTFSNMRTGKGLPKKHEVEQYLAWECWKVNGEFSLPLLQTVSSMHSSKGLPKKYEVEQYLAWECWKINGEFSLPLLRTFSSMRNGKGLPNQKEVAEYLALECWKLNGEFNLPLLRTFSTMCHGKGLPKKHEVEECLAWECWKINGEFSLPLLRTFSSMCSCKGLPNQKEVEKYLAWECWKINGEFSLPLLQTFSSMRNGKGLPNQKEVVELLSWECWKLNGEFSLPLLRTFSTMCNGKGLPNQKEVEKYLSWECWKVNGKFSLPLLRTFSSICSSKGLLNQKAVTKYLAWECWKISGEFSLPLLRIFSSMCSSKGLPKKKEVEEYLEWEFWKINGELKVELLQVFSPIFNGRGLPCKEEVDAFIQWLPINKRKAYLRIACKIFIGCGLPKLKTLNQYLNTLDQHVTKKTLDNDDADSDSSDTYYEQPNIFYMKAVALFCAAPEKWRSNIAQCIKFMDHHKGIHRGITAELSALESLVTILVNHGGSGISLCLKKFDEQSQNKLALTEALSIQAPLKITKFALNQLSEPDCYEYIELCKNLKPAPDKEQWSKLQNLRNQLNQRFEFNLSKRMMLEILWPQSWENISKHEMDSIFKAVPTISQLYLIHQAYTPEKMKKFLDACLAWQAAKGIAPKVAVQESLLEGLLLAKHTLNGFGSIPKLCFSTRIANENGLGVIIKGVEMSDHKRLFLFIAAMLIELEQTEYKFLNKQLTILPPDSEAAVLPKPEFAINGAGFIIKNWSLNQLTDFFNATEFTEQWYQKDRDARELCTRRREKNLTRMATKNKHTDQTENKKITPLFAPSVIIRLINNNIELKSAIWESIEGYAQNDQIGHKLCTALEPLIQKDPDSVSDMVKNAVTATMKKIQAQRTMNVKVTTLPPPTISTSTFKAAMEQLSSFNVLNKEELELLEPHRAKMTTFQLMALVRKINVNVDFKIQQEWFTAFDMRKKNPLDLGCLDDDLYFPDFDQEDQEDQNQDWIEDLVQ